MSKEQVVEYLNAIKELKTEHAKVEALRVRISNVAEELNDPLNPWVSSESFPPRDYPDASQIKEALKYLAGAHKKFLEIYKSLDETNRKDLTPPPEWAL